MSISPEPVELFQRLKKQIEARSMPYQIPSTFVTMQATEMVNMALRNGFLREKCSLIHILAPISIKCPFKQPNSFILHRTNMY
jgi:hypothetical protein